MNIFISFEGPDCVGKSTQIILLSDFLSRNKIQHITTKEPCDTFVGKQVSDITRNYPIDSTTETLLLLSQRIDHLHKVIKPNLKSNTVITDRFHDSTIAYQVHAKGVDQNLPKIIETELIQPNITFIMMAPIELILTRIAQKKNKDNFELSGIEFFQKVISGYFKILEENPNRCIMIDATQSIKNIHQDICTALSNYMINNKIFL